MKFTKRELKEKLGLNDVEVKLVMNYQEKLPILSDEAEGFCINARKLHEQLCVGTEFARWIDRKIQKYKFNQNEDYIFNWIDKNNSIVKIDDGCSVQKMVALGYETQYLISIDMAKELSMVENNEYGIIARKYFILIENTLKNMLEWKKIREPEKELYKQMCVELDKYFQRNFDKRPMFYDYSNEAESLNLLCLGAKSKAILAYFAAKDNQTREHLLAEFNMYLSKMQELNIMYLRMNIEKMKRYDLIKQGFKALYPFANFVIANNVKEKEMSISIT